MSKLKKGDLVKAWDDDPKKYVVGTISEIYSIGFLVEIIDIGETDYCNAIEIPPELAKQLEELGK